MILIEFPRRLRAAMPTLDETAAAAVVSIMLFSMTLAVSSPIARDTLPTAGIPLKGIVGALIACIVAPICEEVLFRDTLPRILVAVLPVPLALVLSAGIFATIHIGIGWPGWIVLFAGALLLSAIYARFGNIIVPMMAHIILNGAITAYMGIA